MTRPGGPGPRRAPARRAPGTGGMGALRQGASPAEGAVPADDPSHGFVDAAVPELAIGVAPAFRGRGLGIPLLEALVTLTRGESRPGLSLRVDPAHPALRLSRRLGFEPAERSGSSPTCLLRFR